MEVLSSRVITYPPDFDGALSFYDGVVGLQRYREYGRQGRITGVVYFLGGGFLEVASAGTDADVPRGPVRLWLQVADVDAEHHRLVDAGAEVTMEPATMPWGLREMEAAGPGGVLLRIVQVPEDHPLRRRL